MAREIVHLQIGQCGNRVGSRFWENILYENRRIEDNPITKVYFNETIKGQHIPRSILIGMDPEEIDRICTGKDCEVYTYNYLKDKMHLLDETSNWALSHYVRGLYYGDKIFEFIRKEVEKCDSPQGFQIVHSLGGGCGSGLGTFILNGLRDEYPDRTLATFSIIPSPYCSELTIQPYNFVLSLHHMIEMADEVMCFDNEAIYRNCVDGTHLSTPTYGDLNYLISSVMSNFTCPFRFPNLLNSDLNKTVNNLVTYQRLHFTISSIAPISSRGSTHCHNYSAKELSDILFNYRFLLACCKPIYHTSFGASACFRGRFHSKEAIYNEMTFEKTHKFHKFTVSHCNAPCYAIPKFASLIENTTAINDVFNRLKIQFEKLYCRKFGTHLFVNDGLESVEFDEAYETMKDLICEYEIYDPNFEYDVSDDEI